MSINVHHDQWKPAATAGNHGVSPQRGMPLLTMAPPSQRYRLLPTAVLSGATFSHTLQHAALHSCLDQNELAKGVGISKSYMTKFLAGVGERWARLLVQFMSECCDLGPLQWMAAQVGCELVQCDTRAAEVAALRARLNELEKVA